MSSWITALTLLLSAIVSLSSGQKDIFYLKSSLHNMVIEIMYRDRTCGALVGTNWQQASGNDHQLWYAESGTLRSKMNDFCLEKRKDKYMVVSPCIEGEEAQLWNVNGDRVQHGSTPTDVLEVAQEDQDIRARIQVTSYNGKGGQSWTTPDESSPIDPRPTSESGLAPIAAPTVDSTQFFFIKSKANFLAVTIKDKNPNGGAEVHLWSQVSVDNANQLWYVDPTTGILKSKLNGYCLTTTPQGYVVMAQCAGCAKNQNWLRVGELCQNGEKADLVLDIAGYNLNKGARMSSWAYHGGDNQKWIFEACTPQRCR